MRNIFFDWPIFLVSNLNLPNINDYRKYFLSRSRSFKSRPIFSYVFSNVFIFNFYLFFMYFQNGPFLWKKSFSQVGESNSKNDDLVPFNVTVPLRFLVRPYRPLPFFILDYTPLPDRPWPSLTARFYCKFDIFYRSSF